MKKIFRRSQKSKVTGRPIYGSQLHKYGLPYIGAAGTFLAEKLDLVDLMLAAVERHPELHIVTRLLDRRIVNRYEPENASSYHLHLGNADPEIEFTREWSADDFTEEELARHDQTREEFRNTPLSTKEIAAVNWILKNG